MSPSPASAPVIRPGDSRIRRDHSESILMAGWVVSVPGTYPAEPISGHDSEDLPKELVGSYLIG